MIVLVPYRPDNAHRDTVWSYLKTHYWDRTGYRISVGQHVDGPFNRAKALNAAADCDWDYAVIADSDTFVPQRQLEVAALNSRISGRLCAAFDCVVELTQTCTNDILDNKHTLDDSFGAVRVRRRPLETQSSMLVIPRGLWDRVGGFDEGFVGWAGEDNAFWKACALHGGEPLRVPGNAYHLWHPPATRTGPHYDANQRRWRRYDRAETVNDLC